MYKKITLKMSPKRRISAALLWFILTIGIHMSEAQFDTGMSENRVVISNLFHWPFKDIAEECKNVLGPHGFGAVLVSPILENAVIKKPINGQSVRPWWEIYRPISFNINNRLGTEDEFKNMVQECNKNKVRVYVDTVLNHAANSLGADANSLVRGTGGTTADTKKKDYPGFGYNEENFHNPCQINYTNATSIWECELWGLPDIDQSKRIVQKKMVEHLNKLISFGVAGFRVDAAKHIRPEDLLSIYKQLDNVTIENGPSHMRPYWMLEVTADTSAPCIAFISLHPNKIHLETKYENMGSLYDFSMSNLIPQAIYKRNLSAIYEYEQNPTFKSQTVQIMTQNQDSTGDVHIIKESSQLYETMVAFLLSYPKGVPNIFSGFDSPESGPPADAQENLISPKDCKNGWRCEHRKERIHWITKFFTNVVKDTPVRKILIKTDQQIAFSRGDKGFVVMNLAPQAFAENFTVSLPKGEYCDLATGYYSSVHKMCMGDKVRKYRVEKGGALEIQLPAMPTSFDSHNTDGYEPTFMMISTASMVPKTNILTAAMKLIGYIILIVVGVSCLIAAIVVFIKRYRD